MIRWVLFVVTFLALAAGVHAELAPRRGLEHFVAKHNRCSTLEARELIRDRAIGRRS